MKLWHEGERVIYQPWVGPFRSGRSTKALIFDFAEGRLYLSDQPWNAKAPPSALDHLPSYGLGQFVEWHLRVYTTRWGAGERGTGRTTTYAVSLKKTDGGFFDVMCTGFQPMAEAWLRQWQREVPLGPTRREPSPLPLPSAVERRQIPEGSLYSWPKTFRPGSFLQALLILAVVAAGFFLVLGDASGEIADQIRLILAVPLTVALLVIVALALRSWRRSKSLRGFLLVREGSLESGEVRFGATFPEGRRVENTFDFGADIAVRYDRVLTSGGVVLTFHSAASGAAFLIEFEGLSEGEAVALERQFEQEIRRRGGRSQ